MGIANRLKMRRLNAVLKGIALSLISWIFVSAIYVYSLQNSGGESKELYNYPLQEALPLVSAFGGFCFLTGSFCGLLAGLIKTWRRLKLVASGLLIYWLEAVILAALLTLLDTKTGLLEKLTGALWLGSIGALMFSIIAVPFIVIAALALEYWTRER